MTASTNWEENPLGSPTYGASSKAEISRSSSSGNPASAFLANEVEVGFRTAGITMNLAARKTLPRAPTGKRNLAQPVVTKIKERRKPKVRRKVQRVARSKRPWKAEVFRSFLYKAQSLAASSER